MIWQILANHGGGYQYRLCPADEPGGLTEECFFRTPLAFNPAKQAIQWTNGHAAADPRHVCPERNAARRQHLGHEPRAFPNTPHLVPTPSDGISCCRQIPARCLGPSCHAVDAQHPFCKPCPLPVAGRDCTSCDDTPEPCFPPPCDESSEPAGHTSGLCSGNFNAARVLKSGPVSVVDSVLIPPHLKPGKWVLVSPATVWQPSRQAVA
eukprot:COSAG04_NODE_829_length_10018_cov_8.211312_1_plen_208_part_00